MVVEVVDSVLDYQELLWGLFDIPLIEQMFQHPKFDFTFDGMNAVTGPYARKMFGELLGTDERRLMNCTPMEDFGGLHPDPNLKHAAQLVKAMGCNPAGIAVANMPPDTPDIGAASDGDGDRNMIMGRGFFVSPSDSVAVIAANAECIPSLAGGLKGVARSMPTSGALDLVAKAKGVECFVTPTGWKYFGNLMDANRCSICGEESFGTGSDHVREKDGIWAVLAWLNILAVRNQTKAPEEQLISVKDVVEEHWATFGRNFYTRYDYEEVTNEAGEAMMEHLRGILSSAPGQSFNEGALVIKAAEEFSYTDPIDGSVADRQGIIFTFEDGSRVIFRLSGTGSAGATIRMYVDKFVAPEASPALIRPEEALGPLLDTAIKVADIESLTGRTVPSVIT